MPRQSRMAARFRITAGVAAVSCAVSLGSVSGSLLPAGASASSRVQVPSLLSEVGGQAGLDGRRAGVDGVHTMMRINDDVLPAPGAAGQRLALPTGEGSATITLRTTEQDQAFDSWRGVVEGDPMATFDVVRIDGVYRVSLLSPKHGNFTLSSAGGDRYWWTEVAPTPQLAQDDAVPVPPSAEDAPGSPSASATGATSGTGATSAASAIGATGAAASAASVNAQDDRPKNKKRRKAKIRVMFAFTKGAKAEAGSKAALKAAAALIISQTNHAMKFGKTKSKVKYAGLVKGKGKNSTNVGKNLTRLYRPRDGQFDKVLKQRRRRHADLVQLIAGGAANAYCGRGFLPLRLRQARRQFGLSSILYSCVSYVTGTHEISHNLGADHDRYAGVSHQSKMRFATGFVNPTGGYFTAMGYPNKCVAVGIYCVPVPYYSHPKRTVNGSPLGTSKRHNNSKAVRTLAHRVARYYR